MRAFGRGNGGRVIGAVVAHDGNRRDWQGLAAQRPDCLRDSRCLVMGRDENCNPRQPHDGVVVNAERGRHRRGQRAGGDLLHSPECDQVALGRRPRVRERLTRVHGRLLRRNPPQMHQSGMLINGRLLRCNPPQVHQSGMLVSGRGSWICLRAFLWHPPRWTLRFKI